MRAEEFRKTIATRLKTFRMHRGMSLDAVARATGVSKAMLGQIERMESTPTIALLWKIASGLQTSFSAFFAVEAVPLAGEEIFPDDPNMQVRVLFPYNEQTRMEVFEVELARRHQQQSDAHHVGVIEHVVVQRGRVAVLHDGAWQEVPTGAPLRFHADQPHGYAALGVAGALFLNIINYT